MMKKSIAILFFLIMLPAVSHGASGMYWASCLTGGTTGCLDKINGASLSNGDSAIVVTQSDTYIYFLDSDSGLSESSPSVISPDTSAGTKRWVLVLGNGEYFQDDTIDDDSIDLVDITLNDFSFDVGTTTKTEFGYLAGVTSAIQTQFSGKESSTSNDFDPDRIAGDTTDDNLLSADLITDGVTNAIPTLTQETNWNTAYGWGNHASAGYLTAEVDGSTSNEIEIADETFNATNFNGGTTSGVSQDDFYDLWHGIDTDDDGDIDTMDTTVWATKLSLTDIDDTPVDSETAAPISSNWAYDHVAASDPHTGYQKEPVEGAFADGDKTKLDAIEAGADVTDATNVAAAGARMDSEYTSTTLTVDTNPEQITPTSGAWLEEYRCSGSADTYEIEILETNAVTLMRMRVSNVDDADTYHVDDAAGNVENPNNKTVYLAPGESAEWVYVADRWVYVSGGSYDIVAAVSTSTLKASELSDTSDPHGLIERELLGTILTNSESVGADEWDFPARTEGWNFIFMIEAAQNITLDPNGTEQWYLNGTQMAAGEAIVNTAPTVGESIACISTETAVYCKSSNADFAQEAP